MAEITAVKAFVYSVLAVALIFFTTGGLDNEVNFAETVLEPWTSSDIAVPDFGQYVYLKTLSASDFPIDEAGRRVIIVGDIHGMYKPLKKLLKKVSYDPKTDVLVHVGDILTKVPHKRSMQTLEFMASNNITGVRGNHDQAIIEWRGWMDWIRSLPGGSHWLDNLVAKAFTHDFNEDTLDELLEAEKKKPNNEKEKGITFRKMIPKGWKLFDHHFHVAYDMTPSEYRYLTSLPLTLHIPSAHTFIVHAGLLSHNPKFSYSNPRQPLTRVPKLRKGKHVKPVNQTELKRKRQEQTILQEVPQNTVPWNILNMRTVVKGKVSKTKTGIPWTTIWNNDMSRCNGFDNTSFTSDIGEGTDATSAPLPCYPSTVIYGHIASKGLNPKRWSIGLDSGCVYGRRLTALILGANVTGEEVHIDEEDDTEDDDDDDVTVEKRKKRKRVRYGDDGHGRIASVSCT